nr:FGGY-family carbohydrate kinase [Actinomycetota bacterium]
RLSGGWSTNPVLRELKSAAFVNPVYPRVAEAGIRGAALLAGLAAERFASLDELPEPALVDELVTS